MTEKKGILGQRFLIYWDPGDIHVHLKNIDLGMPQPNNDYDINDDTRNNRHQKDFIDLLNVNNMKRPSRSTVSYNPSRNLCASIPFTAWSDGTRMSWREGSASWTELEKSGSHCAILNSKS